MPARLFCKTGQLAGSSYQIDTEATIGTSSENAIVLYPKIISGKHARIFFDHEEGSYYLEDLGSRNGTRLDGLKVSEKEKLGQLHVITFANTFDFMFQVGEGVPSKPEPETPEPETPKTQVGELDMVMPQIPDPSAAASEDSSKTVMDMKAAPMPDIPTEPKEPDVKKTVMQDDFIKAPEIPDGPKPPEEDVQKTVADADFVLPPKLEDQGAQRKTFALRFESLDQTFPIKEGENIIGRALESDICVDDASMSRRHASLTLKSNKITIKDLKSKNHTFVDDNEIKSETEIKPGDKLGFGEVTAVLTERT